LGFNGFELNSGDKIKYTKVVTNEKLLLFSQSNSETLDFENLVSIKTGKFIFLSENKSFKIITNCLNFNDFPHIIRKYKKYSNLPINFKYSEQRFNSFSDLFNMGIDFNSFIIRFINYIKI
jgi:hypothetical protein